MKTIFLLLSLFCMEVHAQWSDNFTDGNFTSDPAWFGDTAKFIVNPAFQLQLNAPAIEGLACLSVNSDVSFRSTWEFRVKMDFNPSAQNYAKVYLMSNVADVSGPLHGYYLKVGGTNKDLCLYRQQELKSTIVANGRDKMFDAIVVNAHIKVTRDESGSWFVYCDTTGGNNYNLTAQGNDNAILLSSYFAVQCFYTKMRSTKFSFDDFCITGERYNDGTRPFLENFSVLNREMLHLTFSEPIDSLLLCNRLNYSMGNKPPVQIHPDSTNNRGIELTFADSFACGYNNELQIRNMADIFGLTMNDTVINFQFCRPQLFDIVFNELMIDPAPPKGLPEAEYLELYNRSGKLLDLTGWHLFLGTKNYTFPEVQLAADGYLLVTSKLKEQDLSVFGKTVGLFTSSTSLNNTGQFLRLENAEGQLIAWLEYNVSWHDNESKAEGGWSIEQIDPWNVCREGNNWRSSCGESGGTPGCRNSVYEDDPDVISPYVSHVNVPADTLIDIYFNEPIDSIWAGSINHYHVIPDGGAPKTATIMDRHYLSVRLLLDRSLNPGQIYSLKVEKGLTDCAGNAITEEQYIPVGLPEQPDSADIVINEVLFNARTGGSDYVELYNRSDKILNAQQILLGIDNNGIAEHLARLSERGFLIFPSTYVLLTSNIEQVKTFYKVEDDQNLIGMAQMPSLDDHISTIVLLNDSLKTIDKLSYSEKMHLASLKDVEGISLERVDPDKPSSPWSNWVSAAESAGYGTPGYKNSQFLSDTITKQVVTVVDNLFSPDSDGNKDILQIAYQLNKPGCHAQVYIFDAMGRLVRRLLNNEFLSTQGSFTWDGTSDTGEQCSLGMYVIYVRIVFDNGTVREYKKTCILAIRQ